MTSTTATDSPPAIHAPAPPAPLGGRTLDAVLECMERNVMCRQRGDWRGAVVAVTRPLPDDDSDAIQGGRSGKN